MMQWKIILSGIGRKKIADGINVTNEAVRLWLNGDFKPRGKNLKSLCDLMKKELPPDKFTQFMSSLAEDLTGISTEI